MLAGMFPTMSTNTMDGWGGSGTASRKLRRRSTLLSSVAAIAASCLFAADRRGAVRRRYAAPSASHPWAGALGWRALMPPWRRPPAGAAVPTRLSERSRDHDRAGCRVAPDVFWFKLPHGQERPRATGSTRRRGMWRRHVCPDSYDVPDRTTRRVRRPWSGSGPFRPM